MTRVRTQAGLSLGRTLGPMRTSLAAALSALAIAGCTPTVDHRGYLPKQSQLQQLQIGMPKPEVEALLGSPSTTATINTTGDSYYYISSVVDQVQSFAQYGLEDGEIVNISDRRTPTRGKELSVIQQLFSNIGRFSGPGG